MLRICPDERGGQQEECPNKGQGEKYCRGLGDRWRELSERDQEMVERAGGFVGGRAMCEKKLATCRHFRNKWGGSEKLVSRWGGMAALRRLSIGPASTHGVRGEKRRATVGRNGSGGMGSEEGTP